MTYCSIWPWTEAISASTSRVFECASSINLDACLEMRLELEQVEQPDSALALDDRADGAVLQADDLRDLGQRTDPVQLVGAVDLLGVGAALRDQRDRGAGPHGTVERLDAAIAADLQRHDHLGEDHRVAQRHHRQHLDLVDVPRFDLRLLVVRLDVSRLVLAHRLGDDLVVILGFHLVTCPFGRGRSPVPVRLLRRNVRHQLHRTGRRRGSCRAPRAGG